MTYDGPAAARTSRSADNRTNYCANMFGFARDFGPLVLTDLTEVEKWIIPRIRIRASGPASMLIHSSWGHGLSGATCLISYAFGPTPPYDDTLVGWVVMAIGTGSWSPGFLLAENKRQDRLFSDQSSGGVSSSD